MVRKRTKQPRPEVAEQITDKNLQKVKMPKRGRPSKFDQQFDVNHIAFTMSLLGATDEQLADAMNIDVRTLYRWKNENAEFCQAIKNGKQIADANVAESLFNRAVGYTHPAIHFSQGTIREGEETRTVVVQTPYLKHYPPDTTAAIFWLKNRTKNWRDVKQTELTGANAGPIQFEDVTDDFSDDELDQLTDLGIKLIKQRNGDIDPNQFN